MVLLFAMLSAVFATDPATEQYNRAALLVDQFKYDEAVPVFQQLIREHPDFHRAYSSLAGVECQFRRDCSSATGLFNRLVADNDRRAYAHLGLGAIVMVREPVNYAAAIHHFAACIKTDPDAWPCYVELARTLFLLPNREPDVAVYERALPAHRSRFGYEMGRMVVLAKAADWAALDRAGEAALAIARGSSILEAEVLFLTASGSHASRVPHWRNAVAAFERTGNVVYRLVALELLSVTLSHAGQDAEALRVREEWFALARQTGNIEAQAAYWQGRAEEHEREGRLEEAIRIYELVEKLTAASRSPFWFQAPRWIGTCLRKLGRLDDARAAFERAVAVSRQRRSKMMEAYALRSLGAVEAERGQYFRALQLGREATRAFKSVGAEWQANATAGNLGSLHAALGDYEAARRLTEQSLASARTFRDQAEQQRNLASLAALALRMGRPGEALGYAKQSIALASLTNDAGFHCRGLLIASSTYRELGLARRSVESAAEAVRVCSESLQRPLEAQALAALGHAQLAAGGEPEEALGSALAMVGSMGLPEVAVSARYGLALAHMRRQSFHEAMRELDAAILLIESMRADLPEADLRAGFLGEHWRVYDLMLEVLSRLHERERAAGWDRKGFAYCERARARALLEAIQRGGEPLPLETVQAALGGAMLLEYSLGERRSLLWVVTGRDLRMFVLPPRGAIEKQVAALRAGLARRSAGPQANAALYGTLLPPTALRGPLLIVPDGVLQYVPFEGLVRGGRYLVEEHTISYAHSASVAVRLASREPRPRASDLIAYADPVFGGAAPRTGSTAGLVRDVYRRAGIRFPQLPNTRDEVARIADLFPPDRRTVRVGAEANEAALKKEPLANYRVLHFATHAVVDEREPARSGIVLSLVGAGLEDGILRVPEIFNLKLDADLVVLSACHTGLGKLVRGEGMVGLTNAFLHAGTPRLVVSLWEVNDVATAAFMEHFYRAMQSGLPPGAALQAAKLRLLRSGPQAYRHPFYWAPFVVLGGN